ncbi:MAG: class I SAM-dependent methyltransferase, partial [Anaerolineae bacterium]
MTEPTNQSATSNQQLATNNDDLLWRQLKTVPAFRALLRAVEARFYRQIELPGPILDLGCGDGHFTQMTFDEPLTAGADPWWGPLQKAQKSGMYGCLAQSMGDCLPFPNDHFATVISNSVLEHIPDVQTVLIEANRVMQPDGRLIITMPSHLFTEYLGGAEFFERLGAAGLANRYRRFFNRISRHAHTDSPELWAERLAQAGFAVERWQYYFSREALHALEWGHVQGTPSAILHALTGHWILGPWEDNLRRTERWVRPFYEEPFGPEGAYIFFVARKKANGPIEARLPAARAFSIGELEIERLETEGLEIERLEAEPEPAPPQQPTTSPQPPTSSLQSPPPNPRLISGSLIFLSLFFAAVGQSILNAHPLEPADGLRWYIYSLLPLLDLAWRQRRLSCPGLPQWQRPSLGQIPRQRRYYPLAFFLALLALRIVNNPSSDPQPGLAFLLWLVAGGVAFYSLLPHPAPRLTPDASRFTLIAGGALFLTAFIIRAINLT